MGGGPIPQYIKAILGIKTTRPHMSFHFFIPSHSISACSHSTMQARRLPPLLTATNQRGGEDFPSETTLRHGRQRIGSVFHQPTHRRQLTTYEQKQRNRPGASRSPNRSSGATCNLCCTYMQVYLSQPTLENYKPPKFPPGPNIRPPARLGISRRSGTKHPKRPPGPCVRVV